MTDRVTEAAARLDSILMPVARMRIETMGAENSGAYNFYEVRVGRGSLFTGYELELAALLDRLERKPSMVHEIGVGWGQLSFLLAALGIDTVALEIDRRRYAAGAALHAVIEAADPALAQRSRVLHEKFPSPELEPEGAMAVATNLVFTTSAAERRAIIAALGRYPSAIIDIDRFLTQLTSPDQRAGVLEEFAAEGMTGELFADLGGSACFYRFTRR